MSTASLFKFVQLAYLSRPATQRPIYRCIRRNRVRSIVELGLGDAERARRVISVAQRYAAGQPVRYAGIDLFEARPSTAPGITLKLAHRLLKPLGTHVQLIPGDPYSALVRVANALTNIDLVLISADQDAESLSRAWFYLPRMLHERSVVLAERRNGRDRLEFAPIDKAELASLAASGSPTNRRAA